MGACLSKSGQIIQIISSLSGLKLDFTPEEWDASHNKTDPEETKGKLWSLGSDLDKTSESKIASNQLNKTVFICCNTYTREEYSLGVGPMNDSINVASYMATAGYTIFFLHNPTADKFASWLGFFFENVKTELLVYYTGHGASIDDDNGDEADGLDEAYVFDDSFLRDDKLIDILQARKKTNAKVILLSDCCHSGSIWDIQSESKSNLPGNVMSLSAARDSQTAKQTSIGGTDQGIFTFYFFKLLEENKSMTPSEMESKINGYISKYEQHFTKAVTTAGMENKPIFG